jgi:hypothetical protein
MQEQLFSVPGRPFVYKRLSGTPGNTFGLHHCWVAQECFDDTHMQGFFALSTSLEKRPDTVGQPSG